MIYSFNFNFHEITIVKHCFVLLKVAFATLDYLKLSILLVTFCFHIKYFLKSLKFYNLHDYTCNFQKPQKTIQLNQIHFIETNN